MRPETLLPWLLGTAIGAAGLIQGWHWRSLAPAADDGGKDSALVSLENELALLRRENESLRSLAQGGGEVAVDPQLIAFVEDILGQSFRSSPLIHRIAPEELRDRIMATIESRYGPHGLESRQQAWSLMGLLGENDLFGPQLAATKAVGARSWFDEQSGEGWVTTRFDPQSVPDQAALVRALGRILIHQHNPPAPGWPGDEAALAREAVQHGAAMAMENNFMARQALANGFAGAQENAEARQLMESLPVFVRGVATFPSVLGLPFAQRLMDQEEILSGLHRPPPITAVFFPDKEGIEAKPPELPHTPGNPLLDESAGMLGLQLWLEPLGGEAAALADAWLGDRYRLSAISDTDLRLLWDIRFSSEKSADAFLTAAADLVSSFADKEEAVPPGQSVVTPAGRKLTLLRAAPDVVRFTNDPE